jgi:hypothetical protein
MFRKLSTLALALFAVLVLGLIGCGQEAAPHDAGPKDQPAAGADDTSGLAELSEADRKLAEKQKSCPVTDELLGSMGKPYKMTVKGRVVFLCCEGCKGKVEADPDKYLKKLDERK